MSHWNEAMSECDWPEEEGPGWEMQEDNERQRWEKEQAAMNKCRRLTRELRDETTAFEQDTNEHHERVRRLQWQR